LLRFEISDYTASTTCTIFDDEAKRMLNITVLNLLESFEGNIEDVPKSILQLYGKVYIFQFKMNNPNLTEGRQGYVVRKAFIPIEKLEKDLLDDNNNEVSADENLEKDLLVDKDNDVNPDQKVEEELLNDKNNGVSYFTMF
jgi:hypothetical protein